MLFAWHVFDAFLYFGSREYGYMMFAFGIALMFLQLSLDILTPESRRR